MSNSPAANSRLSKPVEASMESLAEIMGVSERAGLRMHAGPVLKKMYQTALSVALKHGGGRPVMVGMDRIDLAQPISHMDLLRLEGCLLEVSGAVMVVKVLGAVKRYGEREFENSHIGYFSMVSLNARGGPQKGVPRLDYASPEGQEAKVLSRHRLSQLEERQQAFGWVDEQTRLLPEEVLEADPVPRYEKLRPQETEVRVKGQLFSQGVPDGRIRAGEMLEWMDRVATYTASQFTRNPHVITISVNDLNFRRPLHADDHIELIARVTYVRTHTLEVNITPRVYHLSGEVVELDPVDFLLLNHDASGLKRKIATGLNMDGAETESLRKYLKAKSRYQFWKNHPESHLSQAPA